MNGITLQAEGLVELQTRIAGWPARVERAEARVVEYGARRMMMTYRTDAPRSTSPGQHFADSFEMRQQTQGSGKSSAEVFSAGSRAFLLPLILGGTRPHVIRSTGESLVFTWDRGPYGPGVYFFRKVNHPGTQPNRFDIRSWDRVRPELQTEINREADELFTGV